jgi:RNA polymerase sigma-70 factor (ECF subfamily)
VAVAHRGQRDQEPHPVAAAAHRAGDTAADEGPVDAVLAAERRTALVAAVNALPDKERQVLVCRYFLDLSEAGTAQVLGWPLGSVKSRRSRALTRLHGLLAAGPQSRVSSG